MTIRKVRTPEGSKFYDLPIGSPITADIIEKKNKEKAAKGLIPPKGALTGSGAPSVTAKKPQTPSPSKSSPQAPGSSAAPAKPKVKIIRSTTTGPAQVKVGNATYSVPAGSKVIRPKNTPGIAYVRTQKGEIHVFNEVGEIDPGHSLRAMLKAKFDADFKGSEQYDVEDLEGTPDDPSIKNPADAPEGSLAKDEDGETLFTKDGAGHWVNSDLGLTLDDADLQEQVDSGVLVLHPPEKAEIEDQTTAEAPEQGTGPGARPYQFKSKQGAADEINALPAGSRLLRRIGTDKALFTKNEDGTWTTPGSEKPYDHFQMATTRKFLEIPDPDEVDEKKTPKTTTGAASMEGSPSQPADKIGDSDGNGKAGDSVPGGQGGISGGVGSGSGGVVGSEDPSGEGAGVVLASGHKPKILSRLEGTPRTGALKAQGKVVPDLYELDAKAEASSFRSSIQALKDKGGFSASVYVYDEAEYADMRLFLTDDGTAGIALHDDEIVSVFVMPDSKHKGAARSMVARMVDQGGTRLDAFDTVLPHLYAKEGFVAVARVHWDDEYAPDDWNYDTFSEFNGGRPDVVFMKYDADAVNKDYVPGSGQVVTSYDDGVARAKKPLTHEVPEFPADGWAEAATPGTRVWRTDTLGSSYVKSDDGSWDLYKTEGGMPVGESSSAWLEGKADVLTTKKPDNIPPEPKKPLVEFEDDLDAVVAALKAMPEGTVLHKEGTEYVFTKQANGDWTNQNGVHLDSEVLAAIPDELVDETLEKPNADNLPGPLAGVDLNQPEGTQVFLPDVDFYYQKVGNAWQKKEWGTNQVLSKTVPLQDVAMALATPDVKVEKPEPSTPDPATPPRPEPVESRLPRSGKALANLETADAVKKAIDNLPVGSILGVSEKNFFLIKSEDGKWRRDGEGTVATPVFIFNRRKLLELNLPKKPPAPIDLDDPDWVDKAKPGQQVWLASGLGYWEKTSTGEWELHGKNGSFSGEVWPAHAMKHTKSKLVTTAPSKIVEEPPPALSPDIDTIPDDALELAQDALTGLPVGTEVWKKYEDGSTLYFEKVGKTSWSSGMDTLFTTDDLTHWTGTYYVDKASVPAPKQGDKILGPEDLDALLPNSTLRSGELEFVKVSNNAYVSKAGKVVARSVLLNTEFEVVSVAPSQPKALGLYAPNDQIQKYGHLRELPAGAKIRITVDKDNVPGYLAVKQSDGQWLDHDGDAMFPDEMANNIIKGQVFFHSAPGFEPSDSPTISLIPSGAMYSPKQIQEAIDALEAHTGFQISYGFKSIPDHPLADKNIQDAVKNEAALAFPGLKPKQAFVAYLKKQIGEPSGAPKTPVLNDPKAPKIHLGVKDPEITSIQGWNGGDFTAEDVAEAIDILKAFNGKLFKAELNKKGNPLGQLDPNELVGFNKDKAVTKQKFIDLLTDELAKHQQSLALKKSDMLIFPPGTKVTPDGGKTLFVKHPNGTWIGDEGAGGADTYSALLDTYPGLTVHSWPYDEPLSKAFLDYLPEGTRIRAAGPSGTTWVLEKNDSDEWVDLDNPLDPPTPLNSLIAISGAYYLVPPDGPDAPDDLPEYATPPAAVQSKQPGTGIPLGVGPAEMPDGASLVAKDGKTYYKAPTGWVDGDFNSLSNGDIQELLNSGQIVQYKVVGNPLQGKHVNDMGIGDILVTQGGVEWKKVPSGNWMHDSATIHPAAKVQEMLSAGLFVEHKTKKKAAPEWDGKNAADAPIGTELIVKFDGDYDALAKPPSSVWRKIDDSGRWWKYWIDSGKPMDQYNSGDVVQVWLNEGGVVVYDADAKTALHSVSPEGMDPKALPDYPVGKTLYATDGKYIVKKDDSGNWDEFHPDGTLSATYSEGWVQSDIDKGKYSAEKPPQTNLSGLTPGKYSTPNGKAYMVVKEDGSGVYVNAKGDTSNLTPAKVKANHKAGMSTYHGLVTDLPQVDPNKPKATPAKKAPQGPVDLPDGTYYLGSSSDSNATIYVVADGQVKIYKGGYTQQYEPGVGYKNILDPTVEAVPLAKVKTAYFQGKIVDKNGNSVVPKGHTGPVIMWDAPTTVQGLVKVRKSLVEDPGFAPVMTHEVRLKMAKQGLLVNTGPLINRIKEANPNWMEDFGYPSGAGYNVESKWHGGAKSLIVAQIDAMLADLDTSVPDVETASLFEWQAEGVASMPDHLIGRDFDSYHTQTITKNAKDVAAAFGDGKILVVPASKYEKQAWLKSFSQGNFANMYLLEVQSLAKKGKAHPAGYKHPGYDDHTATHKITWGPAVPGEMPVHETVPGEWSNVSVNSWSPAEVDNYLISAHMAHPQYLTMSEKRSWVDAHKAKNKPVTDKLSITAKKRKELGATPESEPLVWTDGVVPAKSYDYMFDDGPFPGIEKWTSAPIQVALDWAKDNWTDEEFQAHLAAASTGYDPITLTDLENPTWSAKNRINHAVQAYWGAKHEAYLEELAKPVYTKTGVIEGDDVGFHEVWTVSDQFGRKYVFKPIDKGPSANWRADVEKGANDLGQMWGFNTPGAKTMDLEGKYGVLMDFADNIGSFSGIKGPDGKKIKPKMASLTDAQLGQIASEHVLDWVLDNDDTHHKNMLFGSDGNLVGIDKGRAFRTYGQWNGLSGDLQAHSNANLVFTMLYDDVRSGKVSEEQARAAYLSAMKAARRIQRSDDAAVADILRDALKDRPNWAKDAYMTHFAGKAPENVDELIDAVLARKAHLVEQIDEMWERIYAASPYDKPEIPKRALGDDHFSGWEEDGLLQYAAETKIWGTAAIHSSPGITGGSSLVWKELDTDGQDVIKGQMHLGSLTQAKVLEHIQGKVTNESPHQSSNIPGFSSQPAWKSVISAAGKDASKHVEDKEFTEDTWTNLTNVEGYLAVDTEHWSPDLEADDEGFVEFPSGVKVPKPGLYQYKALLDHYSAQAVKVREAREKGLTTEKSDFTVFQAVAVKKQGNYFDGPDGEKYIELANNSWMHIKGGEISWDSPSKEIIDGTAEGWSSLLESPKVDIDPVKYTQVTGNMPSAKLDPEGNLKATSGTLTEAHHGYQIDIALPTGEVIHYQNAAYTSTYLTQQGMVRFTLAKGDAAASLERIRAHLIKMGLDLDGAEVEDAETIYWRQMFSRVLLSDGGPGPVQTTRNKLLTMRPELTQQVGHEVTVYSIPEAIGLTRTPDEERKFWRDLANETWGPERVSAWIAGEHHLPQYQHLNLADPTQRTGKPYYKRIDVDVDELRQTGTLVAIGNNGKDAALMRYLDTGGMLSTEQRIRSLGYYKQGASSTSDQDSGGASGVFTRLAVPGSHVEFSGAMFGDHVAYWSPDVLTHVGTYSFTSDSYGRWSNLTSSNKYNPVMSAKNNTSGDNETLVQDAMSIFDYLEIMIFEDAAERNAAIQRLKKMGLDVLRGLPIEERLIMRENLKATLKKVRAQWQKIAA